MGRRPSAFEDCGDDCPVESVDWSDAAAFANAVSEAAGLDACYDCATVPCLPPENPYEFAGYRLPTEAEWEYAARAAALGAFPGGGSLLADDKGNCGGGIALDDGTLLDDLSWYCGNSVSQTWPVATLGANAWGLHDMGGNVWEWCNDWYEAAVTVEKSDPVGPAAGKTRVVRGGSQSRVPDDSRSANRHKVAPDGRYGDLGFRLVISG